MGWVSSPRQILNQPACGLLGILAAVLLAFSSALAQTTSQVPGIRSSQAHTSAQASSPFKEAEELLSQGSIEQAKEKIQEQLALHPKSVEGYTLLGIAFSAEKDYPKALEAFQQALKIDPNSTKTHNNLGNLYITQGKPDLAQAEFQKTLRIAPNDRDGNYNLGLLLLARNSPAEAIFHFSRIRPQTVETRFNLIRAYLLAAKTAEGMKVARDLSAQNKDDVRLHFTLGVLLASAKQYQAAQLELEKANALQPETPEILYNLGQAYLRTGDYAKAEVVLNRALKLKPDSPETLYLLAQVDSDQSRPVDALDLLARAHKLAPDNTDIIFLLARVSMSQNYFEDAIPLLESGLKIAPKRADLRAALGESYFMSGRAEKAIDEFKALIEVDPSARSYADTSTSARETSLPRKPNFRRHCESTLIFPKPCWSSPISASRRNNLRRRQNCFASM
jgi:tetratricopeptide (TPR) repeat protein